MALGKDWHVKLGVTQILLVILLCPVYSIMYYQQYRPRFLPPSPRTPPPPVPRYVRQSPNPPYYLNVQRYIAVPGRVIQNVISLPYTTVPVVRNSIPLVSPYLQQPYYQLESDPGNPGNEDSNGGDGGPNPEGPGDNEMEPPPQSEPPPPSPESEPEPEQPPPMMNTMQPPPPPPENDNDDSDDDDTEENHDNDNPPPPPPPPQHHGNIIHKHISVHVPPDNIEAEDDEVTVIRPKVPGPQKSINIIFIKAPSTQPRKQSTVILPELPQQKTLVYVLVKRPDPANDGSIRIRGPPPTKPPKPQVFFVRYKQKKEDKHHHHHH